MLYFCHHTYLKFNPLRIIDKTTWVIASSPGLRLASFFNTTSKSFVLFASVRGVSVEVAVNVCIRFFRPFRRVLEYSIDCTWVLARYSSIGNRVSVIEYSSTRVLVLSIIILLSKCIDNLGCDPSRPLTDFRSNLVILVWGDIFYEDTHPWTSGTMTGQWF